jgi:hypothetical protein
VDQLAAHRRRRQLLQRFPLVALRRVDRDLHNLVDRHVAGSPEGLDDDLAAHSLLHQLLDLLQDLSRKHHHGRCTISHLRVL